MITGVIIHDSPHEELNEPFLLQSWQAYFISYQHKNRANDMDMKLEWQLFKAEIY